MPLAGSNHHVTSLPVVDATGRLQGLLHEVDVIRGRVPHQAPGAPSHSTPPSVVADVIAVETRAEEHTRVTLQEHPDRRGADVVADQG